MGLLNRGNLNQRALRSRELVRRAGGAKMAVGREMVLRSRWPQVLAMKLKRLSEERDNLGSPSQ